jgi:hypothetical protein
MAMLKIIFDRTPEFRQWGILLGDSVPQQSPMSHPVYRLRNKRRRSDSRPQADTDCNSEITQTTD